MPVNTNRMRPWTAKPHDPGLGDAMHHFLDWTQTTLNQLIGSPTALPATTVTVKGINRGVIISWTEVGQTSNQLAVSGYQVFESNGQAAPNVTDLPLAIVPPNHAGVQNQYIRTGIFDLNTRYYFVRAVSPVGVPGAISAPVSGKAASIT